MRKLESMLPVIPVLAMVFSMADTYASVLSGVTVGYEVQPCYAFKCSAHVFLRRQPLKELL